MRAAPPVSVRCTGGLGWRVVQTLLPALAAGVLVWWALALFGPSLPFDVPFSSAAAAAVCAAACGGAVGWRQAGQPATQLAWDGEQWTLDSAAGVVDVMLDLNSWLLLRHRPAASGHCWVAVSATDAGPAFHGLRAAVYARPSVNARRTHAIERTAD